MKRNIFLIVALIATLRGFCANPDSIDTGHHIVVYNYRCHTTAANGMAAVDSFRLAVIKGEHITYCGEYFWTMLEMVKERSNDIMLGEFDARRHNVPSYYLNAAEGTMTTYDKIIPERYIVEGDFPQLDWTLHPDTLTISGFLCQKAETHYAGRTWQCWFTEDIPLTVGPWKLGGLPGLIMQAEDKDGVHSYTFDGLLNRDVTLFYNKGFGTRKPITQREFVRLRNRILCDKRYARNPRYYLTPDVLQNTKEMWAGGPEPPEEAKQTVIARDMIVPKTANVFQPLELK